MSPLFGRSKNDAGDNAVRGEALVLSGDPGISGATQWTSLAVLRVTVPSQPPTKVRYECMVDRHKELVDGTTVPVMVDPRDPNKLSIVWDEVPTIEERIANRDPVILDPVGTWKKLHVAPEGMPAAAAQPEPWADGTIANWPPADALPKGRQPGTAWVLAHSEDARACMSGEDSFMPLGRTHYSYKGTMSYGPHAYMSWVLLRVNPQYADPYGAYFRTKIVRWRYHAVLPVSINPEDPNDIEFCWDAAPNLAREIVDRINTDVAEVHKRVETLTAVGQQATASALANIADPALREQAAQMMGKYGMGTASDGAPAVAAAPQSSLERLQKLHSSGVLTDAEFDAERAKLSAGN